MRRSAHLTLLCLAGLAVTCLSLNSRLNGKLSPLLPWICVPAVPVLFGVLAMHRRSPNGRGHAVRAGFALVLWAALLIGTALVLPRGMAAERAMALFCALALALDAQLITRGWKCEPLTLSEAKKDFAPVHIELPTPDSWQPISVSSELSPCIGIVSSSHPLSLSPSQLLEIEPSRPIELAADDLIEVKTKNAPS
jgi:hypothetical protein